MKINKTNQLILILLSSLFMNQSLNAEINKYIRYSHDNDINYGIVSNDMVFELTKAPYLGGIQTGKKIQLNNVRLLAPAEPSKVLAVGFNYHSHRGDLELPSHPPIFLKLPSSIIGPNENIIYHSGITDLHYEAELVAVIGKRANKISKEEAGDYIFGVTAGNDVSARNWQAEDGIRDFCLSRGLGDVYKRQDIITCFFF